MPRKASVFTDDVLARVRALASEGVARDQIAKRLRLRPSSLETAARQHRITLPPETKRKPIRVLRSY